MSDRPREQTQVHTRLLKCALEVEDSRAYWARANGESAVSTQQAFDEYWFGARSLARIDVLLSNMRVRFDAFPPALAVLHRWLDMPPDARRVICHWHLQLADPTYRAFTGHYLVERRTGPRGNATRDLAVHWISDCGPPRWTMTTRIQFASKLLSAAFSAGLVASNRDPRAVVIPVVPDVALEYVLYLLREVDFAGTLLQNPYLASVGLTGSALEDRLRRLPALGFSRQGDLVDYGWRYSDLNAWANAAVAQTKEGLAGATH